MSIQIIVRPSGYTRKRYSSPKFYAHYNRSTGRYYGSASDYYSDLKSRGLEPYDSSAADSGKRQAYVPSGNLKQTVSEIHNQTRKGKFRPSDRLLRQMESMGVRIRPNKEDLRYLPKHYQSNEGGFDA